MAAPSFKSFTKKIFIHTTPERLYSCWATEKGICEWFLKKAAFSTPDGKKRDAGQYVEPNDRYVWEWYNWDGEETGRILETNAPDHLVFSFAGSSRVAVDLEKKGEKVLLTLRQYDIPLDEESKLNIHVGCSNGWTFWLANLKAYLEYGILLHETEEDLRSYEHAAMIFVNM
jgi:uncharacterized protein YndB with AHSA1/START domain